MSNEFKQKELKKFIGEEKLRFIAVLETHLKTKNISKVCDKVFGNWSWMSNVTMREDLCSTRFHFTWTKSLKNLENVILKKLDRIMINESFLTVYLISDHSLSLLIFPGGVPKKKPLKKLNLKHGNLFEKAKSLKLSLHDAQSEVDKDPCNVIKRKTAVKLLEEYTAVASDELKLLHHKAKIDWLRDGFLGDSSTNSLDQLGDIVNLKLLIEDVVAMIMKETDKEIKDDIFDIDSSKAFGPTVGFHNVMVKWIMTCISTASFFIFSSVSGLFPNHNKSAIFFGSILEGKKQEFLDIMTFKCGKLPMKYVGVPLLAKRLSVKDCKSLVDNVENRIKCWKNKFLSYVGKIQLIASVLSTMQSYWASVYMIPTTVLNELEKLFRRFMWNSGDFARGKAKVAWSIMCRPKDQRGLGLKPLKKWNEVLLVSQLWKLIYRKSLFGLNG
nr:RNA-directed DNA polymerase, eukaryota, reverse transcriptase zinc-binding domain protein [Tanacetum cinerariifolium]